MNSFTVQCPASISTAPSFDAFLSINNGTTPITSRQGEAILSVTAADGTTAVYPGTLSSAGPSDVPNNEVSFTNVSIPGSAFSFTVSGIRVNASPSFNPLNDGGFGQVIGFFSTSNTSLPITTVGPLYLATILAPFAAMNPAPNFESCGVTTGIPPFPIRIGENFPGAFKVQISTPGVDSETGPLPVPASLEATSGTQLAVTLSNIPSGVTLYVPLTITSDGGGTAQLVTAEGSVTPQTSNDTQGGVAVYPVTSTVYYNVTAINPATVDTFTVPVYLVAASGNTYASIPAYTVQLAPWATDLPAAIPRFDKSAVTFTSLFSLATCATLDFRYAPLGVSSTSETVALSGPANASFTASATANWITVTPASGILPAQLTISINPGTMRPGTYNALVNVVSSSVISPTSIPVQLTIAPPAQVTLTPGALAFTGKSSQTVNVSGLLPGTAFEATAFGSPWLSVTQSGDANSGTITVSADPAGLQPGTYRGAIQVVVFGSPTSTIPVSITVGNTLAVSPPSLSFVIQLGAPGVTQTLAVAGLSNATTGDSGDPLTIDLSAISSGVIRVTASAAGLNPGTYHQTIGINSGPASIQVPVLIQVGAVAPPVLTSVTSGVTFQQGSASPGLFVSLFGSGLGPYTGATAGLGSDGSLLTVTGDTRVLADGVPCPMLFADGGQVNAILPFGIAGQGSTSVQVEYLGVASNAITVPLVPATPGLFTSNASGSGGVAALNQDGSINSASNPAANGSEVVLFGAGAGLLNPRTPDGSLTVAPYPAPVLPVSVTIGGVGAAIEYAGGAPGEVTGVLQVNVTVPVGLTAGAQPVLLVVGSFQSEPSATIYVQ